MFALGMMYTYGKSAKKDIPKGVKYLQKAADLNNVEAISLLGNMYMDGDCVKQNFTKAFNYLQKAADLGDNSVFVNLGETRLFKSNRIFSKGC